MDDSDFGSLARDFGFRPQGKSAPMAKRSSSSSSSKPSWSSTPPPNPHDAAPLFSNPTFDAPPPPSRWSTDFAYDSVFPASKNDPAKSSSSSSSALPVYDKPVYDDDIFEGVPGMKSASAVNYDDVFASNASASPYDDLLGGFAKGAAADRKAASGKSDPVRQSSSGFDDLIPGFRGSSGGSKSRDTLENKPVRPSSVSSAKSTVSHSEDPFVIFGSASSSAYPSSGLFTEPKEHTSNFNSSNKSKADNSSGTGGIFDTIDGFDGFPNIKEKSSSAENQHIDSLNASRHHTDKPLSRDKDSNSFLFDMPTNVLDAQGFANGTKSPPSVSADFVETNADVGVSSPSNQYSENVEEIWLTVSEVPLFTQTTRAPPPARPPPNRPVSSTGLSKKKKSYDSVKNPPISSIDELEELSSGRAPQTPSDGWSDMLSTSEDAEANFAAAASAAAMKEAMDRAEAKFKHAKEVREREKDAKAAKSRDSTRMNGDEQGTQDNTQGENHINQDWLEKEKREREEKEKEQRKMEREREREKARRAVEMATREARERAAAEARLRAERVAVEKATNEARLRAERAAVQKAAAEARERAAAEARERVAAEARERSAAEAREKAAAEAKERAEKAAAEARERAEKEKQARERSAVERAAAEVRLRAERAAFERVQAEARQREAAAARERMQKNENDLESFFGMSARPNSAPRQRTTSDPFDSQFHMKSADMARTSVGTSSNMRKATSTANIVDDLSSIFGAATSSAEFQELEGESEERRKARYERHLRTRERAAKALAEKNERDIQTQREQEERHKIAETMDIEIKRWAFGKEGNLRALLSTLQYVLWPECGWQPVSLTDLITGASVKKVYRKATLCIHPDKVQQKGATLQHKYIAEKVFDLLKEAWNKFNSEELF